MSSYKVMDDRKPYPESIATRDAMLGKIFKLAQDEGYDALSKARVAEYCECAEGTVSYRFGTIEKMRSAVLRKAVAVKDYTIINDAMSARLPAAMKLDNDLKLAAFKASLK